MDLRHSTIRFFAVTSIYPLWSSKFRNIRSSKFFTIRSSLPFSPQQAKYYRELEAAADVVHRVCRICVNVQKSLFSDDGRIMEKNDKTPVTIADFGVQALISLELRKLFPLIPLVAEEDSAFLHSNNLADAVVNVVNENANFKDKQLTDAEVMEAIDRGGNNALAFGANPATYWVLDPIDGTRGFLKGGGALYVVGLSLVVEGEIVLGVMGCPNWRDNFSNKSPTDVEGLQKDESESGIIMIAHVGCGTWTMRLSSLVNGPMASAASADDKQILLLPTCCGSLCKYLMVASGRASVFILRARAQTIIKAWDHVVGMICVHEAGGKVTDWKGSQLDLAEDEVARRVITPSGGILVTNGSLHGQILELISSNSSVVS